MAVPCLTGLYSASHDCIITVQCLTWLYSVWHDPNNSVPCLTWPKVYDMTLTRLSHVWHDSKVSDMTLPWLSHIWHNSTGTVFDTTLPRLSSHVQHQPAMATTCLTCLYSVWHDTIMNFPCLTQHYILWPDSTNVVSCLTWPTMPNIWPYHGCPMSGMHVHDPTEGDMALPRLSHVWHNSTVADMTIPWLSMSDMTLPCLTQLYTASGMTIPRLTYVWHNSIMAVPCLTRLNSAWHNCIMAVPCMTWPYQTCHMFDMTYGAWHDPTMYTGCPMSNMTLPKVSHVCMTYHGCPISDVNLQCLTWPFHVGPMSDMAL